jgi:putative DNA primase/helicase
MTKRNETHDAFFNDASATKLSSCPLSYALRYAELGTPVFPVHSVTSTNGQIKCTCRESKNCCCPGKHPRTRSGVADSTLDDRLIKNWWAKHPNANIGLRTGKVSGIFVLDVDLKNGGPVSLEYLEEFYKNELGELFDSPAETLTSFTGGGGRHYIFKYPTNFSIPASCSTLAPGLDIRSDGNYIIAPPSLHKSGRNYSWHGVNTPVIDAPKWLTYEILVSRRLQSISSPRSGAKSSYARDVDRIITKGSRNDFLFRKACGLINGNPSHEVYRRISEANDELCSPSLRQKEVLRIAKSVERYRSKSR